MPTYDYRCEADQKIYEVKHSMAEQLDTWGELCERAGISMNGISPGTKVTRLISGGSVVKSTSLKNPEQPPCMTGGCARGNCAI